jgi:hypothetical protein
MRIRVLLPPVLILSAACSGATHSPQPTADAGPTFAAPYADTAFDAVRITSDGSKPNFQQATTSVTFHDGPFASVKLVVDLASTCFPWSQWQQHPPPSGQGWPAECDAFDRNFDLTFDAAQKDGDPAGFNVIHAITPFGGPEHLETDITDLANAAPGAHRLRVVIPTWSDGAGKVSGSNGGWNVTARIVATPGTPPRKVLAARALFEGGVPLHSPEIPFTVPAGTTSARLELRTSGHGGGQGDAHCIGPAEEFCHRGLTVNLDDQPLDTIDPWRTDCTSLCTMTSGGPFGQYCKENPCGSPDSVRAPRANWCPGSETPPFTWTSDVLRAAGDHKFAWDFSAIAGGGSWQVSAIYYAYGD